MPLYAPSLWWSKCCLVICCTSINVQTNFEWIRSSKSAYIILCEYIILTEPNFHVRARCDAAHTHTLTHRDTQRLLWTHTHTLVFGKRQRQRTQISISFCASNANIKRQFECISVVRLYMWLSMNLLRQTVAILYTV